VVTTNRERRSSDIRIRRVQLAIRVGLAAVTLLLLSGCGTFLRPALPTSDDVIGRWYGPSESGWLDLSKDGTFSAHEVPDAVLNPDNLPGFDSLDPDKIIGTSPIDLDGTWELPEGNDAYDSGGRPEILLFYTNPSTAEESGQVLLVFGAGANRELRVELGDPDGGNFYSFHR
jgi:hypothetical protein